MEHETGGSVGRVKTDCMVRSKCTGLLPEGWRRNRSSVRGISAKQLNCIVVGGLFVCPAVVGGEEEWWRCRWSSWEKRHYLWMFCIRRQQPQLHSLFTTIPFRSRIFIGNLFPLLRQRHSTTLLLLLSPQTISALGEKKFLHFWEALSLLFAPTPLLYVSSPSPPSLLIIAIISSPVEKKLL